MSQPVRRDHDPTVMQRQARALGHGTRHAIFQFVTEAPAPVRVASLSEHFGLNQNAVRHHLAKLCHAGLLEEEMAPRSGPGRPALQYRPSPEALGTWATGGPYVQLTMMLLEQVRTGSSPRQAGVAAGRQAGAGAGPGVDAVDGLEAEMARRGFRPRRVERGSSVELLMERCPFEAAALASPEVVCELHLGLAEGLAEGMGGPVRVVGLVVHDAERAGCRLRLERVEAPAAD